MTLVDASSHLPFAKKAYRALPQRLRRLITPAAYSLQEWLNILRPQVWSVTGEMPKSRVPISLCLQVTTPQSRDYISKTIFGPAYRSSYLGRTWLWKMQKAPKAAGDVSLVFSDLDASYLRFLPAEHGITIPSWVHGEAKLPRGPKEKSSSAVRVALRKIRQNSLQPEITHDQEHLDDFYDNMYVPHVTLRFGGSAYVAPRERVQRYFEKGELLLIKKDGKSIAGQLIYYEDSCANMAWMGVRDANWEFVRNGALLAVYEFTFRRAEEKGCHTLDMTRARPFLHDGLLQFKKTWSFGLKRPVSHKFLLRVVSDSPATRAFLQDMPFIFERRGEIKGAVFVNGETPLTVDTLRSIGKVHLHDGMSELVVFQLSPHTADAENSATPNLPAEIPANASADPSGTFPWKRLPRAEWMDLIKGMGFAGIEQAIAIYPTDEQSKVFPQAQNE